MVTFSKRKIKLCYLISSLCNEGPVNVVYNIIRYMDFTKFDVSIVTFIPEKENSRLEEFRKFPIEIYQLSPNKMIGMGTIYSLLKKKLKNIHPDEIHAHCPRSLYLMPFLPKVYKKIYTIHIYPGEQQIQLYGKWKGKCVIWLNHLFTKLCDIPIGCAESVGEQYKINKGWNIKCIPNGASLPLWKRNLQEKQALRKELGLQEGIKYFIFVGRFSQEKNPDVLFKAFEKLQRKDVALIMLGMGNMWQPLKDRCPDNIIMPGFTTRVYDYMKASDYYISASDVEGLANTILESMSVGLPMLLSDIPSHREVLANVKGECIGYLIDNHSPEDIRTKIDKIMNINYIEVSNILQNLYEKKYTAEIMSRKYQKVYLDLMEK